MRQAENHEAAIQLILQAIDNAGYTAGEQIALGLDCAASEFYKRTVCTCSKAKAACA